MLVSAQQMPRQNSALHQHKDNKVPNLFWRSISTDTLRANERYVALPPVGLLNITDDPLSHRYVRQDSALWTELHDGMLTTGRLKQALGMHESKAAQVVGIHPGSRGSHHLLSAYFHLLATATAESANYNTNGRTDTSSSSSSSSPSSNHSSSHHPSSTVPSSVYTSSSSDPHPNDSARQQFNQQLAAAAAAGSGTDSLPAWMAGKSLYSNLADLQQICEKVALEGDVPVKMYWGKVQESAALYTLLQIFPAAVVEEVGLFEVDLERLQGISMRGSLLHDRVLTDITTESDRCITDGMTQCNNNVTNRILPRLGASPDGLIVHRVTFAIEDLQLAAERVQATQTAAAAAVRTAQPGRSSSNRTASRSALGRQQQQQQGYSSSSSSSRTSTGIGASESLCTDQQIVQWLLRQGLEAVTCNGSRPPIGVPTADTSSSSSSSEDQEDAADSSSSNETAAAAAAAAAVSSTSTAQPDGVGLAFKMEALSILQELDSAAAVGAARDNSGCATAAAANGGGSQSTAADQPRPGSLAFQPVAAAVLQLLQQYMAHSSSSSSSSSLGPAVAAAAAGGSSSNNTSFSLCVREVVEVKNHCPFAFLATRKGKKGRVNVRYSWRPRGPAMRVHPQWVPQLQMHMLATGCESALLVSRCPESGVRIFRMWRDDAYLQTMMQLLQVLQTQCVVPQIQPNADMYSKVPGYKTFLHRTSAIARNAVCIAAGDEDIMASIPAAADGSNVSKFW